MVAVCTPAGGNKLFLASMLQYDKGKPAVRQGRKAKSLHRARCS